MLIEDETALKTWLIATLEPICDAEPEPLARYVLALVSKDRSVDKLRENCIDRLEVFLSRGTSAFVDQLFDVILNRRYLSDGKKENVQPKANKVRESAQRQTSVKDQEPSSTEPNSVSTTSSSRTETIKNENTSSSQKRHLKSSSPPAKRAHRSYSQSSNSSRSPTSSSANHSTSFNEKTIPCTDVVNDEVKPPSNDQQTESSTYYPFEITVSEFDQQYDPEEPNLDFHRQPMYQQRTLVTVITNPEASSNDSNSHSSRNVSQRIVRTKRHVVTPFQAQNKETRPRKRPWQKSHNSTGTSTTLEVRKIPPEFNTISTLNEHFSKFGTVTNVQIGYDGSADSALIAYGTFQEAETAYKNPEPLFNNRFIKIFWHKGSNGVPAEVRPVKKPTVIPAPGKLHWSKAKANVEETRKIEKNSPPVRTSIVKKEAAKKAVIEIRRKKTGLIDEQIQQQKLLLKKFETAETNEEKESIRALMKQIDRTIVKLKESLRTAPVKTAPAPPKLTEQDLLKRRAEVLKKKLEILRAKTSAEMRRAITESLTKENSEKLTATDNDDRLLGNDQTVEISAPIAEEIQLLNS